MAVVHHILGRCQTVAQQNGAKVIKKITIEIGDFTMIVDSIFRRLFDIAKEKTIAKNAKLVLIKSPGILLCQQCHKTTQIWFDQMKDALNHIQQRKFTQFKSNIETKGIIDIGQTEGNSIFRCENCGSIDTTLEKGKNIIIKNIQVG
ncbi:MAG: hydrogenase maturation nickel metallochaperone HypA/HybF [Promethearchaeota archaeon]